VLGWAREAAHGRLKYGYVMPEGKLSLPMVALISPLWYLDRFTLRMFTNISYLAVVAPAQRVVTGHEGDLAILNSKTP